MNDAGAERATREWLFKAAGQVFGPMSEERLVELVMKGELQASSEVSADGEAWHALGSLAAFRVHLKKAEARARVEREVTSTRKLARRRTALQGAVAVLATVVVVASAGGAAWYLATRRPWEKRSSLLEDFGEGIAMSTVRVGAGRRAGSGSEDEIAVPLSATSPQSGPAPKAKPPSSVARAASRGGAPALAVGGAPPRGGEILKTARYDTGRIENVVARRRASLAPCLREEAGRSPEFSGEIPIEFAVGNDGRVAALWVDDPRFKSGPLRDCLSARLREWSFDPFPGERAVVSLSFRIDRR